MLTKVLSQISLYNSHIYRRSYEKNNYYSTETKDGEEAIIDVNYSNDGKKSEVEFITVQMLNDFLFMKVDEVSNGMNCLKQNNPKIQYREPAN